jgi:hypothetical protein
MNMKSKLPGTAISSLEEARGERVSITDEHLTVELRDGRIISTPLVWYPRLHDASPADRLVWEWIGSGSAIHWPLLDEDLSINGMLEGNPSFEYRRHPAHAAE